MVRKFLKVANFLLKNSHQNFGNRFSNSTIHFRTNVCKRCASIIIVEIGQIFICPQGIPQDIRKLKLDVLYSLNLPPKTQ